MPWPCAVLSFLHCSYKLFTRARCLSRVVKNVSRQVKVRDVSGVRNEDSNCAPQATSDYDVSAILFALQNVKLTSLPGNVLQPLEVPQLTQAHLRTPLTLEGTLYYSLRSAHKLQHLRLTGTLQNELDRNSLTALTHLDWRENYLNENEMIHAVSNLAAKKLKILVLNAVTSTPNGAIADINRAFPK